MDMPPILSAGFDGSALIRKLAQRRALDPAAADHLGRTLVRNVAQYVAREPLIVQGETPGAIQVMLEGWACRWRTGPNGRRQVLGFHLPGDVCDFNVFMARAADATVTAIEPVCVARLSRDALNEATQRHSGITAGLWWETLSTASIEREWLVSLGQRNAHQRIAHLLCELFVRLRAVGRTDGMRAPMPLTQSDIGDACGMTPEHSNRTLRDLRGRGLAEVRARTLRILDWPALVALAGFDPAYLHFDHEIERFRTEIAEQDDEPVEVIMVMPAAGA